MGLEIPSVVNLIVEYFKSHPLHLVPYIIFVFFFPVSDVLLPHIYGKIMDAIKAEKTMSKYVFAVIGVLCVIQLIKLIYDKFDSIIFPKLKTFIMTTMFKKILDRYENDYQDLKTGDIISRFSRTPEIVAHLFHRLVMRFIPFVLTFVFSAIYFFYHDKTLAFGFITVIFIVLISIYVAIQKCKCVSQQLDGHFNTYQEEIDDALRNLYSIYGSEQKEQEVQRIYHIAAPFIKGNEITMECTIKIRRFALPFIICFILVFLMRASTQVKRKQISIGLFISTFVIILYNLGYILMINDSIRDIVNDWGTLVCVSELLEDPPIKIGNSNTLVLPRYKDGLEFNSVVFKYLGSSTPTLNNFNLHIGRNEKVAIVGEIGSGKSTILKLIMKYIEPTEGEIFLDGTPYNEISIQDLRKYVGYIPQQPVLFNRSVFDNMVYGTNLTKDELIAKLKQLDVYDEFARLQHGLDTVIGKNGSKISGGQRQLIWCLRVLFTSPSILIMDEPTASVNEEIKEKLRAIINKVMKDKTVIMVTHDRYLMQYADRIIKLP